MPFLIALIQRMIAAELAKKLVKVIIPSRKPKDDNEKK